MPFTLNKLIVCGRSPFLKQAISGNWVEAEEKIVRLPETEPEIFAVYAQWVHTSNIDFSHMLGESVLFGPPSYLSLGKAWILGDMLLDHSFCNKMIDLTLRRFRTFVAGSREKANDTTLDHIWQHTAEDSKLRLLHTDICAGFYTRGKTYQKGPSKEARCYYHIHDEGRVACDQ